MNTTTTWTRGDKWLSEKIDYTSIEQNLVIRILISVAILPFPQRKHKYSVFMHFAKHIKLGLLRGVLIDFCF